MSRVLVEKETIYTEEVTMLMNGASYQEVIEAMEIREGEHEANPFGKAEKKKAENEVERVPAPTEETEQNEETKDE